MTTIVIQGAASFSTMPFVSPAAEPCYKKAPIIPG